jgi:hypothetical protein
MARYKKRTEEELKELDFGDLMALADVTRALAAAQKEVQYARDELIAKLYEELGEGSGPVIAQAAGLGRSRERPYQIHMSWPDTQERHGDVDRRAVFLAARKALNALIREAGSA